MWLWMVTTAQMLFPPKKNDMILFFCCWWTFHLLIYLEGISYIDFKWIYLHKSALYRIEMAFFATSFVCSKFTIAFEDYISDTLNGKSKRKEKKAGVISKRRASYLTSKQKGFQSSSNNRKKTNKKWLANFR